MCVYVRLHPTELALPADLSHSVVDVITAGPVATSPKVGAIVKLGEASVAATVHIVDLLAHCGQRVVTIPPGLGPRVGKGMRRIPLLIGLAKDAYGSFKYFRGLAGREMGEIWVGR